MIDMRIGKYHLTNDQRNYIVSLAKLNDDGSPKTISTKNGEVLSERDLGYYNSITLALMAIAKDMLKRGDNIVTNVDSYATEICKIDKELNNAVVEYGKMLESIGTKGKEAGKIASSKWEGVNK